MKFKFILLILISLIQTHLFADKTTTQTATTNISSHPYKSIDELKALVLQKAKRQAAHKIYGELVISETNMKNGKINSEEVSNISGGIIRIKGSPLFQNGVNFGDVQVTIDAYATDEDIKKYNENLATTTISTKKDNKLEKKKGFYGEWSGYIIDNNNAGSKVTLSIPTNGQSKIYFPSKNCGGDLLVKIRDIHSVEFKKILNFGNDNCLDKTKILLIRNSDSKLEYLEYNHANKKIMHGSLYREH